MTITHSLGCWIDNPNRNMDCIHYICNLLTLRKNLSVGPFQFNVRLCKECWEIALYVWASAVWSQWQWWQPIVPILNYNVLWHADLWSYPMCLLHVWWCQLNKWSVTVWVHWTTNRRDMTLVRRWLTFPNKLLFHIAMHACVSLIWPVYSSRTIYSTMKKVVARNIECPAIGTLVRTHDAPTYSLV